MFKYVLAITCLSLSSQAATSPSHPHQGKLRPYAGEPPHIVLSAEETKTLAGGKPVYKQFDRGELPDGTKSGGAAAVFKVRAPKEVVWQVLSAFPFYPRWIGPLTKANIYQKTTDPNKTSRDIFVEMRLQKWPVDKTYFVKHNYPAGERNWGTWTLDYSRASEIDDLVGFWRVDPDSGNPNYSVVSYSVDIMMKEGYLDWFRSMIIDSSLSDATQWVKREAEKRYKPKPKKLASST